MARITAIIIMVITITPGKTIPVAMVALITILAVITAADMMPEVLIRAIAAVAISAAVITTDGSVKD